MKSSRAPAAPSSHSREMDDAWRMSRTPRFIFAISTNRTPSRLAAPTRTLRHRSSPRTGQWIGFWSSDDALKKIRLAGGTPVTLTKAGNPLGVSWGADDTIVYALPDGIWSVSGNGGAPEHLVKTMPRRAHPWPADAAGTPAVLFASTNVEGAQGWDEGQHRRAGARHRASDGAAHRRCRSSLRVNRTPCVCLEQHAVRDTVGCERTGGAWGADTGCGRRPARSRGRHWHRPVRDLRHRCACPHHRRRG